MKSGACANTPSARSARAAGKSLDVDALGLGYEHIVVWDAPAQRIAGAYRVKRGAQALAESGLKGLYTAALVDYDDDALARIAQGMELGRSFVAPEYWGSRSIDYLWQGIGAYLCAHRNVRWLFGLVSMSAALPLPAREQIVAYYRQFYGAQGGAASKLPFECQHAPPDFGDMDADAAFKLLKANLDSIGASLPMLYKQYTELCEPGGARFLAFGIDPDFGDSVDGLIEVDMQRLLPKKRQRYIERNLARIAAQEAIA
ncbi:MAG: GNAT family N-acetyltransferase [Nitrospira sp.]